MEKTEKNKEKLELFYDEIRKIDEELEKQNDDNIPSNYYVKPLELKKEILLSLERDELTNKAILMLRAMITNMSRKFSYKYPEDREDCKSFAMMDIINYWRGYDPAQSKYPFAYYSQMIKNGLAKGIRKVRPKSETDVIRISGDDMFNF